MMIICNKCGTDNEDAAKACQRCGRKLQSDRRPAPGGTAAEQDESRYDLKPPGTGGLLWLRHAEPWGYIAVILAAILVSIDQADPLPLYVAVPVVALVSWLRRI